MNETLGQFTKRYQKEIVAAVVALCVSTFGAYVALQLFIQSTVFQIQASDNRITKIETTIYGNGRDGLTNDISVLKTQVSDLHEYFLGK